MAEFYHANFDTIWFVIMSIIVVLLTTIFKLPIKALTKRLVSKLKIEDYETKEEYDAAYAKKEKARKAWNTIILALPFGLGILAEWVFSTTIVREFIIANGVYIGIASIAIYSFVERFFTGSSTVKQEYGTEEGKKVLELVETVAGVELNKTKAKKDKTANSKVETENAVEAETDVLAKIDSILK